jgi:hypothetical protein
MILSQSGVSSPKAMISFLYIEKLQPYEIRSPSEMLHKTPMMW